MQNHGIKFVPIAASTIVCYLNASIISVKRRILYNECILLNLLLMYSSSYNVPVSDGPIGDISFQLSLLYSVFLYQYFLSGSVLHRDNVIHIITMSILQSVFQTVNLCILLGTIASLTVLNE